MAESFLIPIGPIKNMFDMYLQRGDLHITGSSLTKMSFVQIKKVWSHTTW